MKTSITFLALSLLILSGCAESPNVASKVDANSIISSYYVDYDDDTRLLNIVVELRAGTAYLTLDKGAYISWDGEILEMVSDPETNYVYYKLNKAITIAEDLYTTHLFTYRNHEDKLFTNQVTIPVTPTYAVTEATPILLKMSWQIPDQISADGLLATMKKTNAHFSNPDEFFITTDTTQNSGTFFVPNSIVEKFGPGSDVEIEICRGRRFILADGAQKSGNILAKNCGKRLSTTIPKE